MRKIIVLVSTFAFLLQAFPTMAAPPRQPKTKTFAQWCQEKNSVPAATKLTIDLLLKEADTQDCKQAGAKLSSLGALSLRDSGISDLQPLSRLTNLENIRIIIENASVPVIVDAGIGTPSEATQAMEIGADGILLNTAVAQSKKPAQMATAMKLGAQAGRLGYLAGRMEKKYYASASSPLEKISKLF